MYFSVRGHTGHSDPAPRAGSEQDVQRGFHPPHSNEVCGVLWGRLRRPQCCLWRPLGAPSAPPMDAAGAGKIEYFIIFIIFQHRRVPRREAFGATFLAIFGDFISRKSPKKSFGRILLARISGPSRPAVPNLLKSVGSP